MSAYEQVTTDVNYPRPYFHFPDLSGEYGNPYHFWQVVVKKLEEYGYKHEVEEIKRSNIDKQSYSKHFDNISYFLDFSPSSETLKEDGDFVYLKVKKEALHVMHDLKQPSLFKAKSVQQLEVLLECETDFSIVNCYNRKILHYAHQPASVSYLLEQNATHNWFDIFHIDNFEGSFLHAQTNLNSFNQIFKTMLNEDPYLAGMFINSINVFGENAATIFLKIIYENCKYNEEPKEEFLTEIKHGIQMINQCNESLASMLVDGLKQFPAFSHTQKNPNSDLAKQYQYFFLDCKVATKEDVKQPIRKI